VSVPLKPVSNIIVPAITICCVPLATERHPQLPEAFPEISTLVTPGMGLLTEMPALDEDLSSSIPGWLFGLPFSSHATDILDRNACLAQSAVGGISRDRLSLENNYGLACAAPTRQ
jgi:hypothetical protein